MRNEMSARRMLEAMVGSIFDSGETVVLDGSYFEKIAAIVDHENTATVSPETLVEQRYSPSANCLLDFGCGTGAYRQMLENFGYRWRGVNYKDGMQIDAATFAARDPQLDFYDGLNLPYPTDSFDVVYSFQTFEHIQRIDITFSEIFRVLKPGGALIGSVSYLEQVHDHSTFNFTPIGFKLACDQAGLSLNKIYPMYDVFTWMMRRLLIVTSASDDNSLSESLLPENSIARDFMDYGEKLGMSPKDVNLFRLMFSSHFSFEAVKS